MVYEDLEERLKPVFRKELVEVQAKKTSRLILTPNKFKPSNRKSDMRPASKQGRLSGIPIRKTRQEKAKPRQPDTPKAGDIPEGEALALVKVGIDGRGRRAEGETWHCGHY